MHQQQNGKGFNSNLNSHAVPADAVESAVALWMANKTENDNE